MLQRLPDVLLNFFATNLGENMFVNTDKLRLCTAPAELTPETVLGDFVELDATGYAEVVLTEDWVSGIDPVSGDGILKYPLGVVWEAVTQDTDPQTITGWYVVDSTGTTLKAAGILTTTIVIDEEDHWISVQPLLTLVVSSNDHTEEILP